MRRVALTNVLMETLVAQCAIQNMTGTPGLPWITEKMSRFLWKRLLFTTESRGMVEPGMLKSKYLTSFQPKKAKANSLVANYSGYFLEKHVVL